MSWHPARLQVVEDLHPELRALGVLDPQAQDVLAAVGQDAQRQVDRLVAHHGVLADLHPQGVEEHHRVHRLQRPRLPGRDLAHHRVGDLADELRRDLHRVHLGQEALDLAHRHAARVHGDDLVVKAGEAPLVLADELRLEAAGAVARHLDGQRAGVGQHRLGALAVAVVGRAFRLGLARRIAQVLAHLGAQRALDERLLELLEDVLQLPRRHRPGNQLLQQFSRNRRQRRLVRRSGLGLAWHTCSLCVMLCLAHKIPDRLPRRDAKPTTHRRR